MLTLISVSTGKKEQICSARFDLPSHFFVFFTLLDGTEIHTSMTKKTFLTGRQHA